ncbi:hypothetical protein AK812_SmicGene8708 [Symbiodinium microadriaticum]|uniref:Uncharacterized protein n=1 Tax=Symbiodinium microadriaticum TaxID=2951 RepID=A0A1Q9EK74_SYMMI|nr:hypothetical protein AK812_SmicGene8708 [Symbiodinium microadriaticum]
MNLHPSSRGTPLATTRAMVSQFVTQRDVFEQALPSCSNGALKNIRTGKNRWTQILAGASQEAEQRQHAAKESKTPRTKLRIEGRTATFSNVILENGPTPKGFETSLHSPINASTQPKQSLREKGLNRRNTQSSMQACSALMSHMRLRASNGPQMSGGELLQLQKMASSGP